MSDLELTFCILPESHYFEKDQKKKVVAIFGSFFDYAFISSSFLRYCTYIIMRQVVAQCSVTMVNQMITCRDVCFRINIGIEITALYNIHHCIDITEHIIRLIQLFFILFVFVKTCVDFSYVSVSQDNFRVDLTAWCVYVYI